MEVNSPGDERQKVLLLMVLRQTEGAVRRMEDEGQTNMEGGADERPRKCTAGYQTAETNSGLCGETP